MTTAEKAAAFHSRFHASLEAFKVVDDQVKNRISVLSGETAFQPKAEKERRKVSESKDSDPDEILKPRRAQSSVNVVGATSLFRSRAACSDNSLSKRNSQRQSIRRQNKGIPSRSKSDGRNIDKAAVKKRMPPRSKSNETGDPFPRSSFRNRIASVGPSLTSNEKGSRSFRNRRTSMDSEQGAPDKTEKSTRQRRRSSLATGRAESVLQRKARSASIERAPEEMFCRGCGLVGNKPVTQRAGRSLSIERAPEQRLSRGLSRKNSGLVGNEDTTKRSVRGASIERAPGQRLRKSLSKRNSRLVDTVSQRKGRSVFKDKNTGLHKSLSGLNTESDSGLQQPRSNDEESVVTWQRSHKKKDNKLRAVSDHIPRTTGFARTSSGLGTDGLKAASSHGKLLVDSVGLQSHRQRRRNSAFGASCGNLLDSNAIRQSLAIANADKNKNTGKMLVDFPVRAPAALTADFSATVDNEARAMTKNKKSSKRSMVKQISKTLVGGGSNHQKNKSFHESPTTIQSEEAASEHINNGSIHLSSLHRNSSRGTLRKEGSSRGSLSSFISNNYSRNSNDWDSESDEEFAS